MFTTIGNNDVITTICGITITNFDNSTNSFITAANITNFNQQYTIDTLVRGLKIYGLWDKMIAIYPFIGGTASTHKFNLKDPRDVDAAYRLLFVNGWTHNSNGVTPNGTNGYANTYINISALTSWDTNSHLSVYSPTTTGPGWDIGAATNASNGVDIFGLGLRTTPVYDNGNVTTRTSGTGGGNGCWIGTTSGSTFKRIYRNGNTIATNTAVNASTVPNLNLYIGCVNNNGSIAFAMSNNLRFITVGRTLTNSEAFTLNNLINQYQSSLSRAV